MTSSDENIFLNVSLMSFYVIVYQYFTEIFSQHRTHKICSTIGHMVRPTELDGTEV